MVCVISIVILLVLTVFAFLSAGRQGDLFGRIGSYLYDLLEALPIGRAGKRGVESDLERLHPQIPLKELKRSYYTEKLRLMVLVLLVGSLLCLLMQGKSFMEETVSKSGRILRPPAGMGDREVQLEAKVSGERERISVKVAERQLDSRNLQEQFEACARELESCILGENTDLQQVSKPLSLPDALEGYPFEILWKSSNSTIVSQNGEIYWKEKDGKVSVELTAAIYYGEICFEHPIRIQVIAPEETDGEVSLQKELVQAVMEEELATRYEEALALPDRMDGRTIQWKEIREDNSPLFMLLTIGCAAAIYFLKDKDLHDELLDKKKLMKLYYPVILNKFMLYMGAGMTVRGSFLKIAADYQSKREEKGINAAYEEMLYSCHELKAGISEAQVYERFGRRSGLQEYARFTALLGQNLKKGNGALLMRLREESDLALEEELHYRKKLGEEAETKLLVPMIMMMAIVMLLVMIPAFSSLE